MAFYPINASANTRVNKQFPMPQEVLKQVLFWEQIFLRFPSTATLIHDSDDPDNIIDIIDHELIVKKQGKSALKRRNREKLNNLYLKRYNLALDRFKKMRKKALRYGSIEKRVYSIYSKSKTSLQRLYSGKVRIRSQSGLSDEFLIAAKRAQDYLPYMEREFRRMGVPAQITRVAFVESMFNLKARSKVGASGIWQFMPSTGKLYMTINRFIDERNSPFKSAKAAAKLMKENYRILKSWPLAITAYNYGSGGLKSTIKKIKSRDLGKIIKHHKSNRFGFASRNFYGEFLAASFAYDRIIKDGIFKRGPTSLDLASIRLKKRVSLHALTTKTPLTKEIIQKYNPCLKKKAFTAGKYIPLPRNFELFIPRRSAKIVLASLKSNNHLNQRYVSKKNRKRRWR